MSKAATRLNEQPRGDDPHMLAAIQLSQALREAHRSQLFAKKQRAKQVKRLKQDSQAKARKSHANADLFGHQSGQRVVEQSQSRRAGHQICEHLLASLRKQVAQESGFDAVSVQRDQVGPRRKELISTPSQANQRSDETHIQLSLI